MLLAKSPVHCPVQCQGYMRWHALVWGSTVQQPVGSMVTSLHSCRYIHRAINCMKLKHWESTSCKPSSWWWMVYVRSQQIPSWVSNSIETTVGASISKTSHHFYKRYFRLANIEGGSVWGEVSRHKVILSLGGNVSGRCMGVLSCITWQVINIQQPVYLRWLSTL